MNRGWLVWLCASLALCALWVPLRGGVIYAHSDLHGYCVPELELHLHGNHATVPALWDPAVQLGRPAIHTSGLSPAYALTRVLAWVLDDAWVLHSTLVLVTLVLGGAFAWGLFRELGLAPAAAATAALGFAFCPFHGNGAVYLTYVSTSSWTMGLAWGLARTLRAPTLANGVLLALCVHSLCLTGYPQAVVWSAWLTPVLAFAFWPPRDGRGARWIAVLCAALGVGVLAAAPFLLDLLATARRSARFTVDEGLVRGLALHGWRAWLAALGNLADPRLSPAGEPGRTFGFRFTSCSWTPFFGTAVLVAVTASPSRVARCAAAFVAAALLVSASPAVYGFGVRYLGLWLSPFLPLAGALVPSFLLAAIGLDRCLRSRMRWRPLLCALVLGVPALATAFLSGNRPDGFDVGSALALTAAGAALAVPRWPLLAGAALLTAWHYGVRELAWETRAEVRQRIAQQEPLAAEIRRRTEGGGRFAWLGATTAPYLTPNTEQLYGLRSVHSYDSLSSLRFQEWAARVSRAGTRFHGRFFERIDGTEALAGEDFARAGVRLVLALEPQDSPELRACGRVGRVHLYEPIEQRELAAWLPSSACALAGGAARIGAPARSQARVERLPGPDERMAFALEPRAEPGLLLVSQQYHPDWQARAGGRALDTLPVDDFWQGVLVPPGTTELTLEFRPWIRWYWVPQLLFALAAASLLLRRLRRGALARSVPSTS